MTRDKWRLLWYGLLTVLFAQLVILQIVAFGKNFPLLARAGICDAIVLAAILLSKYMRRRLLSKYAEHHKKSN
jgi:hypothetical protein